MANGLHVDKLRRSLFGSLLAGACRAMRQLVGLPRLTFTGDPRRASTGFLLVLLVATTTCFIRLGAASLWDRDEPRNAGCAREMLERHDWVVPVFNGELRTHKPILLYWQTMGAYALLGIHEFSARFSSALLSVGTCILTWAIGRRLYSETVGIIAGCALATSIMLLVAARAATPDATLIFYMTASLAAYVYAAFPACPRQSETGETDFVPFPSRWRWAGVYGLMSMAVLTKGPVGFLLPTAAIGLFLLYAQRARTGACLTEVARDSRWSRMWLFMRRLAGAWDPRHFVRTTWRMQVVVAVIVVAAVALPWYVWVGMRTNGEWLRGFFLEHNLGRATQAMEGHRGSALWFYPAAILFGFFPWSLFAVPVLLDLPSQFRDTKHRNAALLMVSWIVVILGAFSIAKTKLPSYVTPCYPALAVLAAAFIDRWCRGLSTVGIHWMRVAYGCGVLVGVVLVVALPIVTSQVLPGEARLALIGVPPLLLGAIGLYVTWRNARSIPAWHIVGAFVMVTVVFGWGVVRVSEHQRYDVVLRSFPRAADGPVAALACLEPSWVFYSGRVIYEVEYPRHATEFDQDAGADFLEPPAMDQPSRPRIPANQFLSQWPNGMIVVTSDGWDKLGTWRSELEIVARTPRFLKSGEILLIRPKAEPIAPGSVASRE